MVQYRQVLKDDGSINPNLILRLDDYSWIPTDPENLDQQEYLAWVADGNTPLPPVSIIFDTVESIALKQTVADEQKSLHERFNALVKLLSYAP